MLTLLAPARDINVARAAIQAGADAVYIGAPKFGARYAAGNSIDDIRQLVSEASVYGVKVLVTVNTLLTDSERKEASQMIWQLYEAGVDAVIIQDLRLLQENLPPVRLHASTQCDNRTAEQVVRMQELGFKRVVLARELNIKEIADIHQAALKAANGGETIELEAFVHGALCVSYSGRCYLSEVMMNRSANRGECAQMCRQRYDLLDENMNEIMDADGQPYHQRYLLSLQDMDRHLYLKQLIDAGVTTFKIEGRLKDSDYVTNIVAFYRKAIDAITGQTKHRYDYSFTPNPQKTFHRGETDYFFLGRTRPMANFLTPKSTGEKAGRVVSVEKGQIIIDLLPGVELSAGDGLCFADEGFAVNRVSKADGHSNRVVVKPQTDCRPVAGTDIYRSKDTVFLSSLKAKRRIPVKISLTEKESGFQLDMYDLSSASRCIASMEVSDKKQTANDSERAVNTIREQLAKTGNTPFVVEDIDIQSRPYFIPLSTLNKWRRQLTDLAVCLLQSVPRAVADIEQNRVVTTNPACLQPYQPSPRELMTCRYCLLYETGRCNKVSPSKPMPRYLRLTNGKLLMLHFDCNNCDMSILSTN